MGAPITLYRVADGAAVILYGAHYTTELVASGEYSYTPVLVNSEDTPPALPTLEDERPAPKPAQRTTKRKGQL